MTGIRRRAQAICFIGGTALLGYCGLVLADAWVFQREESQELALAGLQPSVQPAGVPDPGGLIGRVAIPRLGVSVMVIEGISHKTLRRAAGHIPGSAMPGHPGNAAISAHRDTFFRPLRNIRQDDLITVTTPFAEYHYRVISIRIVAPTEVSVLEPSVNEVLTLVTCYPFYFLGAAPDRFIVRAERILSQVRSASRGR